MKHPLLLDSQESSTKSKKEKEKHDILTFANRCSKIKTANSVLQMFPWGKDRHTLKEETYTEMVNSDGKPGLK